MRVWGMSAALLVTGSDDDVAVSAGREKLPEVNTRIVSVVDQQQPVVALLDQPLKRVIDSFSERIISSDAFEA
jgi:hypothetical protein